MNRNERKAKLQVDSTEPGWEELYLLGGVAAIALVVSFSENDR